MALALFEGANRVIFLVAGVILITLVAVYPRAGLYCALSFALLGDVRLGDPNTPTFGKLFTSLWGISLTPVELILLVAFAGMCVRLLFDEKQRVAVGPLWLPICVFMVSIFLGIALGMQRGANMDALRSETRGFFYLPALYMLAVTQIRQRSHLTALFWIFVISANLMALESTYRYFAHVRSYDLTSAYDLAFGHENAVFCAAAIMLLVGKMVWSDQGFFGHWHSVVLIVLPLAALLVMRRRAGIVALDAALLLLCIVLLRENLKMFLIVVPLALVGFGGLVALTWNAEGGSGQFARSVRTISGTEQSARDQSSDDYRAAETANVRINIHGQPVTGLGFGRRYEFYVPVASLDFWDLWRYVPHNSVLWVWMKAGIFGFVALLALFAAALTRSTQILRNAAPIAYKPFAFALASFIVMFVMYSYVDLGLVSARALIFFGFTLGTIEALAAVIAREQRQTEAVV